MSTLHDLMAERSTSDGSVQVHFGGSMEPERIAWRLRRDVTAMLRNLEEDLAAGADGVDLFEAAVAPADSRRPDRWQRSCSCPRGREWS